MLHPYRACHCETKASDWPTARFGHTSVTLPRGRYISDQPKADECVSRSLVSGADQGLSHERRCLRWDDLRHFAFCSKCPLLAMADIVQAPHRTLPDNRSAYSMATVHSASSDADQHTALLSSNSESYGATEPSRPSSKKLIFNATLKMALIFLVSTALLGSTLWLALPTLEEYVIVAFT